MASSLSLSGNKRRHAAQAIDPDCNPVKQRYPEQVPIFHIKPPEDGGRGMGVDD
jgi:hypothetical protein